ncbi:MULTISPECIES: hypothetical protein [unclassified Azospirillum]|uniref:hypothetical protein n=1 Tax=unclassified Azospirillum TaxID=2630922 RepID=UPI000B6B9648|nr:MULTISPECIES: hypothetical protein [unclassified Azospirillum]SNS83525.1 phage portal protein, PBSX family [Azospirillum sp. RU38E]SNT00700.1 phage portal protein, PBSX family [Azospirillum sp. RU37A]
MPEDFIPSSQTPAPAGLADGGLLAALALEVEDEFHRLYQPQAGSGGGILIEPPFNPRLLEALARQNNALEPCIATLVSQIDSTGHSIEKADGTAPTSGEAAEIAAIQAFFAQPYPGQSWLTMRKALRRDLEVIGWGALEVLRDSAGRLACIRHLPAHSLRLCRLDAAITVEKPLARGGQTQSYPITLQERRFASLIDGTLVYHREFASSRQLNRQTGAWETAENPLEPADRASEILYFTVTDDTAGPYGLPRWIGQLPSVLGSRRAEEFNLGFFDAGGVPPLLMVVQGGVLASDSKRELEQVLAGKAKDKHKPVVVDAYATGNPQDAAGTVQVKAERLASERQPDSLFETYDARCEARIRAAFRLPPLFVGKLSKYCFTSVRYAHAAAEAQIFKPERAAFDDVVNLKIMPELGPAYRFRSAPGSL